MATRVTLRFDFDADRRLGPGKVALLEAIQKTGSISAAGRDFGMAYRRAWLLTDELNCMFASPLVTTRGGGRNGGGAELTALGLQVIRLYRDAESKVQKTTLKQIARMERSLALSGGIGSAPGASNPISSAALRKTPEAAFRRP